MPPPARGIALPVLAALCLLAAPAVAAQFVPPPAPTTAAPRAAAARAALPDGDLALGGPVDPRTYLVGPGDVFVVSVGGGLAAGALGQATTTVTADGLLVIPQAGTFAAAGRTLAAVRAEARAALARQFRNVPTDVALAVPRRFSVFVSGAVPVPGRQVLSALGRVEDAVAAAAGARAPLELVDYATPPRSDGDRRRTALRNVRVTDRDGAVATVDLLRYYATGELAYNPGLTDGAAVFVPTFDAIREGVAVSGDVDRPGVYDARPDDTAAALVAVAGGSGLDGAGAVVRRTRLVGGERVTVEVPLAEAAGLAVGPRDQLSVRAAAPDAGLASAVGEVAFPGAYPIVSGRTTLAELVEAAGGTTAEALLRGAYLERPLRGAPAAPDPLADPAGPATAARLDSVVTASARLSGLGLLGRRYFAEEAAATPRLSVDLEAALTGAATVRLRDGDRLVVPRDLGTVRVSGQVGAPGLVPFEPGLTAGDYVARAGGQGPAATAVYTVDARTGRFTTGPATPVRPGDAVFVDRPPSSDSPQVESLALQEMQIRLQEEQLQQQAARDRRQFLIQTLTTTITIVSTALFAYSLTR